MPLESHQNLFRCICLSVRTRACHILTAGPLCPLRAGRGRNTQYRQQRRPAINTNQQSDKKTPSPAYVSRRFLKEEINRSDNRLWLDREGPIIAFSFKKNKIKSTSMSLEISSN